MNKIRHDQVADFIESQLSEWQLAKQNYDALMEVKRREIKIDDFPIEVQWNPARIVSTGANISRQEIAKRPCFLCRHNRPKEQHIFPLLQGWEMLVNPYPILPVHLTIVATEHKPQDKVPEDIVKIAELLPDMVIFFNGAKAGASAPDHLHLQAVLKDELPLVKLVEKEHPDDAPGIQSSESYTANLPYLVFSGVVTPDNNGLRTLLAGLNLGGPRSDGKFTSPDLVNTFFWVSENGLLRFIVVPRKAHRPSCYYDQGKSNRMVSPGCIDMAGLMIVPRESDFQNLTKEDIEKIYHEVGIS